MSEQQVGRIANQIRHPDFEQVCSLCGLVVGSGPGHAERHALRHIDLGDAFVLPSQEAAQRAGNVTRARQIAEEQARGALEQKRAEARVFRAADLGITLEQLAEIEAAESAKAERDRREATARDQHIAEAQRAAAAR